MSYIYQTDPYPGRCRNLRPSHYGTGTLLRCLDYEGASRVCTFPADPAAPTAASSNYTITSSPKPWVKP